MKITKVKNLLSNSSLVKKDVKKPNKGGCGCSRKKKQKGKK
jgi:hypothetical protein